MLEKPKADDGVGSPPLARDKYDGQVRVEGELGITPACAGQIIATAWNRCRSKDHPRLRGTNHIDAPELDSFEGSPPLARDK